MTHAFENYLICRDNYLPDPDKVIELSKKQTFQQLEIYPGLRTENLLAVSDKETRDFAAAFSDRLSFDVFPGINNYSMSLYFHINHDYRDEILNKGWIHRDTALLAGLIYLTQDEDDFNSGTSIFTGGGGDSSASHKLRADFNLTGIPTEEYINSVKENWRKFKETIRVGNRYNRLVGYDSRMFHSPNSYATSTGAPRLSLLFFISQFNY